MIRKFAFAVLMVFLLLPPLAGAATKMQVTSSALPASGGSITPNGLQFFTGAAGYAINVNSGWSIGSVLIDNVASPNGTSTSQSVPFDTSKVHTIKVTFSQGTYSINTSAGPGGLIQVTGGGQTGILPGSSRTIIVSPSTGYKIHSYKVDANAPVVPVNPNVAASISINNITADHSVSATFDLVPMITSYAGGNQTIGIDQTGTATATLSGSATSNSGAITYLWAVASKPAGSTASFGAPTNAATTFSADKFGLYTVTLTATSGGSSVASAPATITVTTAAMAASSSCVACHAGISQVTQWLSSKHASSSAGASCINCHMPNSEAHPGLTSSSMANVCITCHNDNTSHPVEIGTNTCASCHNPHSLIIAGAGNMQGAPHFNNVTGGMFPASYMTSKSDCLDCHASGSANKTIRQQWAASGHAATTALPWIDYDFKTRAGCVQCHTTTGFIAFSTAKVTVAWGVTSDKTKEVLTCKGCHSNVAAGTVRSVTPVKPYADETAYTNRNVGTSNICMDCHSGRNNGQSIQVKVGSADFTNLSYVAPHYLSAGGSLHSKSGYHFPGRTYADYSSNSHRRIGMTDTSSTGTDGPCVTCHMSAPNKHVFKVASTSAQSGAITAVTTSVCTNCHNATMTAAALDAEKAAFNNALNILKLQLQAKGFTYSPDYPYFSAKNWGAGQAGANVMGAAFNYKLLVAEPGAYAHNSAYEKQLIIDSIEAVYNNGGTVTGDISAALAGLVGSNAITQAQADSLNAYKNFNSCTSCHPTLSSSHAVHVGNLPSLVTAYNAADTYFNGNFSDSTGYRFGCYNCHPTVNTNHTNGLIALSGNGFTGTSKSNITCAAAYCHSNGKGAYSTSPNWYTGFTGADRCAMCHAASPTTGSHAAHLSINGIHAGSTSIDYGTAANFSCDKCHASTVTITNDVKTITYQNHVNGSVNVAFDSTNKVVSKAQVSPASFNAYSAIWTRTGGYKFDANSVDVAKKFLSAGGYSNGTCSTIACHNNGTPTWGGGALSCVDCHSNL